MRIQRQRWIVKRNSDDKIFCGLARNYQFKSADEIGDTAIKTFLSEAKALSAVKSSYRCYADDDITAILVMETIESIDSVDEVTIKKLKEVTTEITETTLAKISIAEQIYANKNQSDKE